MFYTHLVNFDVLIILYISVQAENKLCVHMWHASYCRSYISWVLLLHSLATKMNFVSFSNSIWSYGHTSKSSLNDLPTIKQFKTKAVQTIKNCWELNTMDASNLLVISSIVDPRFKQLKFLNETVRLQTQTEIVRRIDQYTISAEPSSHCASGAEPRPKKTQGSRYFAWCRRRESFHNNTFQWAASVSIWSTSITKQ